MLLTSILENKHFVFEDPKPSSSNIGATAVSAQEWLDSLDRAREMALTQQSSGPYSAEDAFRDISSGFSSHANTLDRASEFQNENNANHPPPSRNTLVKQQADTESVKERSDLADVILRMVLLLFSSDIDLRSLEIIFPSPLPILY